MRFISLNPEQVSEIDAMMQSKDCNTRTFKRLQSVKLNAKGYSLPQISALLDVHYNSIYNFQEVITSPRFRIQKGRLVDR